MGVNSTEVAYNFGQMGSAFQDQDSPVYPPKDHVIVAIQCLADTTFTVLETETLDGMGPQFPTHQDDELGSAGGPDANYLGVVEAPATSGTAAGLVTLTGDITATNALIKPGQIVLIGADDDGIDSGLDSMDTSAGHVDPIYQGPNKQYLEVESITGAGDGAGNVKVQLKAVGSATLANIANIDTDNTLYFLDSYHGAGGTTVESFTFPKGITVYGRWTKVTPSATGIICYFGK
tara:strand:- start:1604 stop:2305 length:702 start_codon:yes stop_codon:yes gene_type:complete